MPRSRSSYTASPIRYRSPQRSPARRPSEDGSQYELDLDALGMNSTFESTGLDESRDPDVDHVGTSDIEGPEDFTMNMTYWMTADLPLAEIKARKEAIAKVKEVREDTRYEPKTTGKKATTPSLKTQETDESKRTWTLHHQPRVQMAAQMDVRPTTQTQSHLWKTMRRS
jgi:hypothetical protein